MNSIQKVFDRLVMLFIGSRSYKDREETVYDKETGPDELERVRVVHGA